MSFKTMGVYHLALDNFIGYPLTSEGINAYLNSLTCGNAKHNYYRCIKTLCRWLYHTDQLPTNPIEKVLPPRRQKKLLPAISKEQLGTVIVLGKGNRFRKALAGNGIVKDWFNKHDSLETTPHGIQTMLQRLGKATGIKCNPHSFRRGFCVHQVKSGLSTRVVQALGGWELLSMVEHYSKTLTFDDASAVYRNRSNHS